MDHQLQRTAQKQLQQSLNKWLHSDPINPNSFVPTPPLGPPTPPLGPSLSYILHRHWFSKYVSGVLPGESLQYPPEDHVERGQLELHYVLTHLHLHKGRGRGGERRGGREESGEAREEVKRVRTKGLKW